MLLTPGPKAFVKEGKTLDLQCNWTGSSNHSYVNWYLNDDIHGFVLDASDCNYVTMPIIYEIDRYNTTCSSIRFTLSIANISKVKDDGDKWGCDITIMGMHPPSKALTVITVVEDDIMDGNGGENGEPVKELKVNLGGFGLFVVVVIAVGLCLICRRRKNRSGSQASTPVSPRH